MGCFPTQFWKMNPSSYHDLTLFYARYFPYDFMPQEVLIAYLFFKFQFSNMYFDNNINRKSNTILFDH